MPGQDSSHVFKLKVRHDASPEAIAEFKERLERITRGSDKRVLMNQAFKAPSDDVPSAATDTAKSD